MLKPYIFNVAGLIGKLVKYVTPLTIVPTVSLVGLSLFENAGESASKHWGISMGYILRGKKMLKLLLLRFLSHRTIILLTLFSQFLTDVKCPVPTYSKTRGFSIVMFNVFQLFPVNAVDCVAIIIRLLRPAGVVKKKKNLGEKI